jgi:hypothetical protein
MEQLENNETRYGIGGRGAKGSGAMAVMKRLVCYTLETLESQGGPEAWFTLGTYATREMAEAAAAGVGRSRLRILPYYRLSRPGFGDKPLAKPRTAPSTVRATADDAVIVAV